MNTENSIETIGSKIHISLSYWMIIVEITITNASTALIDELIAANN